MEDIGENLKKEKEKLSPMKDGELCVLVATFFTLTLFNLFSSLDHVLFSFSIY